MSPQETGPDDLQSRKKTLRQEMLSRRSEAKMKFPEASLSVRDRFSEAFDLPSARLVACYLAWHDEIDPLPLAERLAAQGHRLCLPVITGWQVPLAFRAWSPGEPLLPGKFTPIPEPSETAPVVEPSFLLVPLLAFDKQGHRLGYGGGLYDRTLVSLRQRHNILAVGLGFSVQEVPSVPFGTQDVTLDGVVTELAVFWP